MHLISVNVGRVRSNPWKTTGRTGIDKQPVDGPVAVRAPGPKGDGGVGLAGDQVFDVAHHGGADQAVYAYAREDLDFWEHILDRTLRGGVFGENLTTGGVDVNGALIGERWRIGADVVLEVSCPRIPCTTFAGWMDDGDWIKRFTRTVRPGAYLRVVEPGDIQAGDDISILSRPEHDVSVALMFRAFTVDSSLLPHVLAAGEALPAESRERIERRLA